MNLRLVGAGAFALAMLIFVLSSPPAAAKPCGAVNAAGAFGVVDSARFGLKDCPRKPDGRAVKRDRRHFRAGGQAHGRLVSPGLPAGVAPGVADSRADLADNDGRILAGAAAEPVRLARGLAPAWRGVADVVTGPARFIAGRLVCALNVNAALAARGIRGTGSASAASFKTWGRGSGPVPGAVAVFTRRGGHHVAIVHSVRPDGTVIYLNPSARRQAWQVGPYARTPIAFRVPAS
jgi:hypothetical protein